MSMNYEPENTKNSPSQIIEEVFSTEKEINNLKYDDILDFNFLQNILALIDSSEFEIDSNQTNENLINHIIYMIKQYLRKRYFDPNMLLDGLKAQLLEEDQVDHSKGSNNTQKNHFAFYHNFDNGNVEGNLSDQNCTNFKFSKSTYTFEEPRWFLVKLVFLIAFLNKDKLLLVVGRDASPYYSSKMFTEGFDFSNHESLKPNFIISTISILSEVLTKIQ